MELFGEQLTRLRIARNLTQSKVAASIRVKPQYISIMEKGGRLPTIRVLKRLVEVLTSDSQLRERRELISAALEVDLIGPDEVSQVKELLPVFIEAFGNITLEEVKEKLSSFDQFRQLDSLLKRLAN